MYSKTCLLIGQIFLRHALQMVSVHYKTVLQYIVDIKLTVHTVMVKVKARNIMMYVVGYLRQKHFNDFRFGHSKQIAQSHVCVLT